jgi:hypothetical protein
MPETTAPAGRSCSTKATGDATGDRTVKVGGLPSLLSGTR